MFKKMMIFGVVLTVVALAFFAVHLKRCESKFVDCGITYESVMGEEAGKEHKYVDDEYQKNLEMNEKTNDWDWE